MGAAREDEGIQNRAGAAVADDEDKYSGDCHITPVAGGVLSENYYTSREGVEKDACIGDSTGVRRRPQASKVRTSQDRRGSAAGRLNGEEQADR